ncbi:MAG: hypothetical protein H0W02_02890 [Ktedonobacteraceae bacterium]|nr:hypothetical protein [Ktedonobacteraceae bacterium]
MSKQRQKQSPQSRRVSGIVGAMLLTIAAIWLVWLVLQGHVGTTFSWPVPGQPSSNSALQIPPLYAEGIILGHPSQPAALNQQQALLIANQVEPDAAANAGSSHAAYVLLTYTGPGGANFNNTPAWMIFYRGIPLDPADAAVDPTPFPQSHHDLYVFLDANTGKELLAIWV